MTYHFKSSLIIWLLVAAGLLAPAAFGQSLISGDIAGTVTDPSHAVVPNATIGLTSVDEGSTQTTKTNGTGYYRFSLLKPGNYKVTARVTGFSTVETPATVAVGQTTNTDISLSMSASSVTVEVSGAAPTINTTSASIATPYSQEEVALLPNPGGDLTNIAQTSPGAQMNNTGGYGNFTMNGLPATSNLFTVNGENDMDPYFNINNSGATNLTIGSNEIEEATVIANAYSGEYGQLSGAQVTYVTKSGTNKFHGNAQYWWNGRTMNSNNWMNNNSSPVVPRPFSNANQWAGSIGGPIIKNKTFFFFDTEGLRFVLPNVIATNIPTPAFASAVLQNVGILQPASLPLFQQMMGLFANAPGAANATPIANNAACNALTFQPGVTFNPATTPCFATFNATPSALAKEWIIAAKVDQNIGQNDKFFARYKVDHGVQPTYLDPLNSNFDALSNQPSWDAQAQETHIFSPTKTNEFTAALSHYVAQFAQNEAKALGTFPQALIFGGDNPLGAASDSGVVGRMEAFPQGRNITQYQFIDNVTWTHGNHGFKFGANFRRYDVSDHNFFYTNPLTYFYLGACSVNVSPCPTADAVSSLQLMANGLAGQYRRADNAFTNVPVALWGLGVYAMDEWKVKPNLTLTLALRAERNSNPVCQKNCFANFKSDWFSLPSVMAGANAGNVPYTSDIAFNQHQAYPGVDKVDLSPRFGFSYSPRNSGKQVISGGFGIFYDSPPAGLVDDLLANPPVSVAIRVRPATGTPAFDTGASGSASTWSQSAAAFNSGFANGATYSQIAASLLPFGVHFAAPSFTALTGTIHAPRWEEWNLQLQQQLNTATVLVMNYVGNHGIRIPYENGFYNAYDGFGLWPAGTLPGGAAPPVPNYGTVIQVQNGAVSNYNGLTVSLRRNFAKWFSAHANYTWAHNLDELSNGGIFPYGGESYNIPQNQLCPQSLKSCNYGSSDYDIRNSFNADFVVHPSYHFGNGFMNAAFGGWEWSGKMFWRGGLPFSVVDGNLNGGVVNGNATVLATPLGGGNAPGQLGCGEGAASISGTATPCLNAASFLDTFNFLPSAYSTQRRNQYVGPHFFDMDMGLFKTFKVTEGMQLGVGAQAYNVFNHPNFQNPDNVLGDSTFGQINAMQPMPTSPYGVFLGFDSSVRVVQVSGKLIF